MGPGWGWWGSGAKIDRRGRLVQGMDRGGGQGPIKVISRAGPTAKATRRGGGCGRWVPARSHDLWGPGLTCWHSVQTSSLNWDDSASPATLIFVRIEGSSGPRA